MARLAAARLSAHNKSKTALRRRAAKGERCMSATADLTAYRAWLQNRERSPGTIAKYLRDTARFFAESGAPQIPPKAAVAAWRDALAARGYAPASVNAMLAAVNAYQDFCGNPAGKAKPLKCQRRIFCEARRELSRAEYFRLLDAARRTGRKRTLLVLQTLCATGIRVSELRFITAEAVRKGRAAIRCKGKCREILLPKPLCHKLERWCARQRIHNGPVFLGRGGQPLDRVTVWKMLKALCKPAGVARDKVFPHNLRHLFARTFLWIRKKSLETGGPVGPLQHRDDAHLYYGIRRRTPETAGTHAPFAVKNKSAVLLPQGGIAAPCGKVPPT